MRHRIAWTWSFAALAVMLLMMGSLAAACGGSVPGTELEQVAPIQNPAADPESSNIPDSQVPSPTVPPASQSVASRAAVPTSSPAATAVPATTHSATPPVAAQVPAFTATPNGYGYEWRKWQHHARSRLRRGLERSKTKHQRLGYRFQVSHCTLQRDKICRSSRQHPVDRQTLLYRFLGGIGVAE